MKAKEKKKQRSAAGANRAQTQRLDASRVQITSISSSNELPHAGGGLIYTARPESPKA